MLTRLPNDLIRSIIQYLSNVDIQKLSYTCSRLKGLDLYTLEVPTNLNKLPSLIYFINNTKIKISLNLSSCNGISDPEGRLRGVSVLGGVTNLDLSCCEGISDVSALGGVKCLDLSYCDGISDVSTLGRVTTLDLSWCNGISDVSALGRVTTLDLSYCYGISDVSGFRKDPLGRWRYYPEPFWLL